MKLAVVVLAVFLTLQGCSGRSTEPFEFSQAKQWPLVQSLILVRRTVQMDELTVRFDSVLYDERGTDTVYGSRGYATVALEITNGSGESARVEMRAWGTPEGVTRRTFKTIDTLGYYLTLRELSEIRTGDRKLPYSTYNLTLEVVPNTSGGDHDGVVMLTSPGMIDIISQGTYDVGEASISGDRLNLPVYHGGGCAPHYFVPYLIATPSQDSGLPEAMLILCHYSNMDGCMAYILESLSLDLTPARNLCPDPYPNEDEGGKVLIHIMEYNCDCTDLALRPVTDLVYTF